MAVDFCVPGLFRDAAEQRYAAWVNEVGAKLAHPTARLPLIRWTGQDVGQPTCTASVGNDIDCGPNPQGEAKLFVSEGAPMAIIETVALAHIYSAASAVPRLTFDVENTRDGRTRAGNVRRAG